MPSPVVLYARYVPTDVKNHFKAWCAKRDRDMKEVLVEFMNTVTREEVIEFPVRLRHPVRHTPVYVLDVPLEAKNRFKKLCRSSGRFMEHVLIAFMATKAKESLSEEEILRGKRSVRRQRDYETESLTFGRLCES